MASERPSHSVAGSIGRACNLDKVGDVKRTVYSQVMTWAWLMVALGLLLPARAGAQGPNRVGLVVHLGDGNLLTRCVEFPEAEISGYDVLERAGLQVVRQAEGMGSIVCSIQGVGCPVEDCFCQCKGATCTYWSYWHLAGEQWSYSTLGADAQRVRNGDVEGWNWGEEDPPPLVPFDQICAPPATATPVPTATPTDTPLPPPSVQVSVWPTTIAAGQCAEIRWQVEHVRAVYLDGVGVGGTGTQSVCPTQSQTYELRVVSASGESRHPVTVDVVQPTATHTPTVPPAPTPTVAAQATATATAAPTDTPVQDAEETPAETPTPSAAATEPPSPTASPTLVATATEPPTVTPTATVTWTPTPRPVAQLPRSTPTAMGVAAERPSPTPNDGLGAPGSDQAGASETTNYVLFGVLMAVLVGVGAVILIQRRR
jgi:hypothetical protein